MIVINPFLLTDFYKTIHHLCYAKGMTKLVSYWTPRMSRKDNIDKVVMFGLQPFLKKYLIQYFNENFFHKDKEAVVYEYKRIIAKTMGNIVNGFPSASAPFLRGRSLGRGSSR